MDTISEMLGSMSKAELKEFQLFLHSGKQDKLLELLDLLNTGEKTEPENNQNAFKQLRFRLGRKLEDFISNQISESNADYVQILRLIFIAQFFFERKNETVAWKYLLKAEEEALSSEQFSLLDRIYYFQLEYAHLRPVRGNADLIEKWENNRQRSKMEDDLNAALSSIRSVIRTELAEGRKPDIEQITTQIYKRFNISHIGQSSVRYQTKLGIMLFELMEPQGQHLSCAEHLKSIFNELERSPHYEKRYPQERKDLIVRIAECLVKGFSFRECEEFLDMLDVLLPDTKANYALYLKSKFIRYICYSSTERLKEAEDILTALEKDQNRPSGKEINFYFFRVLHANWTSLHFIYKDYKQVLKHLNILLEKEKEIKTTWGTTAVVYIYFIELMARIELGENRQSKELRYLDSRLKSIERRFRDFFGDKQNKTARHFLSLIRNLIADPNYLSSKVGRAEAENYVNLPLVEIYKGDTINTRKWVKELLERGA